MREAIHITLAFAGITGLCGFWIGIVFLAWLNWTTTFSEFDFDITEEDVF